MLVAVGCGAGVLVAVGEALGATVGAAVGVLVAVGCVVGVFAVEPSDCVVAYAPGTAIIVKNIVPITILRFIIFHSIYEHQLPKRANDGNRTHTVCLEGRGTTIMQRSRINLSGCFTN